MKISVIYSVSGCHITDARYPQLSAYCSSLSARSKFLRNAALFRVRQKDQVQPDQQEVIDEVHLTMKLSGRKKSGKVISCCFMDRLKRCTGNPDYFNDLPSRTAQWILKGVSFDFKGLLKALEAYYEDPASFK